MDSRATQEVAQKVYYEWMMLEWTFDHLCDLNERFESGIVFYEGEWIDFTVGTSSHIESGLSNALIESCLIHVRNLRDFLCNRICNRNRHQDDVLAVHFFDSPDEWRPSELDSYLDENRERLNKSVAHLSYKRLEYEQNEKEWDLFLIVQAIHKLWNEFLSALPEDRREWFSDPSSKYDPYL